MEIAIIVEVEVKPGMAKDFIRETKLSRTETLKEKGCIRYNILQNINDENKFTLSEIYLSEDAIQDHRTTKHFLSWRDNVQPMMAKPRVANKHFII